MDSLLEIIKTLKKEEIRNFKIYMNRFQRADELKVVQLFDTLRSQKKEIDNQELVTDFFPESPDNLNAFYRLKNRLKTELEKSLVNLHHNLDEKTTVLNLITLSSIFAYKSQNELSLYYLRKAERIAAQNEFYDLLEFIFDEIISLSHNFTEINPLEYIEKRKEVAEKNLVLMQTNHAIVAISHRLRVTNFNRVTEDISGTLQEILEELQIASEIYKTPKVKFRIHLVVSDILLQNQNFTALENYLLQAYREFEEEGFFSKATHPYKINLITWIINTLIVNRKFDRSFEYTQVLYEELQRYNKLYYDKYIWTYHQSCVTNFMRLGRLDEAIELLQEIKEESTYKGIIFYDYIIYVNLSLCQYFKDERSSSIRILAHLLTKDVYPKLSNELQFAVSLLELILHYENRNLDFVGYRLAEIKRQFKTLLKREDYKEEVNFLKIISALTHKADPLHNKKVLKMMKSFVVNNGSVHAGSGKNIEYGVWVKAKLDKQSYYDTLLETLQAVPA